jgi:hypothetical protein
VILEGEAKTFDYIQYVIFDRSRNSSYYFIVSVNLCNIYLT